MGTIFRRERRSNGQSAVELAMVLPFLLLLAAGVIEFGQAYYQYNTLSKAVREAARYMSQNPYDASQFLECKNLAVYGNSAGTGSPIIPDLTIANILITSRLGGISPLAPPQWVKVSVTGYTFTAKLFGLIPLSVDFAPAVEMRYVGLNATF